MNREIYYLIQEMKWWCTLFRLYYILKYRKFKNSPKFHSAIVAIIAILINIILLILLIKK